MEAVADSLARRQLLERALRPLGALGTAAEFPQDRSGIEKLTGHLPPGRPSEPQRFAFQAADELPRYDDGHTIRSCPPGTEPSASVGNSHGKSASSR